MLIILNVEKEPPESGSQVESESSKKFREYLAREFGIEDVSIQNQLMKNFRDKLIEYAQERGLMPKET